jgi:hypothetical protein
MCTNIGICAYMFSYILAHDLDHQRRQCAESTSSLLHDERLLTGSRHSFSIWQLPECAQL